MKFTTVLLYTLIITVFICTNALAETATPEKDYGEQTPSLEVSEGEAAPVEADVDEETSEDLEDETRFTASGWQG